MSFIRTESDPDLDDDATRYRWFGGVTPQAARACNPIVSLYCESVLDKPLGEGLVRASAVGASEINESASFIHTSSSRSRKKPMALTFTPDMFAAVRSALYTPGFILPVTDKSGESRAIQLTPGRVFGSGKQGPAKADIMVVSSMLNSKEIGAPTPFSGDSHEALWDAWDQARLPDPTKLSVYGTYALKFPYYPWFGSTVPAALKEDAKYILFQEILLCRPKYLWLMGSEAVKMVLGRNVTLNSCYGAVTKLSLDFRRYPDDDKDIDEVKVVVSDASAAVQHDPEVYPRLANTAALLADISGFSASKRPELVTDYRPVYTPEDLLAAVEEAIEDSQGGGYVAIDCEWDGMHPSCPGSYLYTVQFSTRPGKAWCVFVRRQFGKENPDLPVTYVAEHLNRMLKGPGRNFRLVGHNLKADLVWLESIGVDLYDQLPAPEDDPEGPGMKFGWQKTYTEGFFDTLIAAHVYEETADAKLELQLSLRLGLPRHDMDMEEEKQKFLKDNKLSKKELTGYGFLSESGVLRYGCADADGTGRLYLFYNGNPRDGTPGALDSDRFKQTCRDSFWVFQYAAPAWAEFERHGLLLDDNRHAAMSKQLGDARDRLYASLRAQVRWPEFNIRSTAQLRELLFGTSYVKKPIAPLDAVCLNLSPFKATDAGGGHLWNEALRKAEEEGRPTPDPSTDKETLLHLLPEHPLISTIIKVRTASTAMSGFFKRPQSAKAEEPDEASEASESDSTDEASKEVEKAVEAEFGGRNLTARVCGDGRVRSMFGIAETGRGRSGRPNLQNVGEGVDESYNDLLGLKKGDEGYFKTASVFIPQPGWVFVKADLKGAEIVVAGWTSGDKMLLEHAARSCLDEKHPDYLDLHCDLAVRAFNLDCAPTKAAFEKKGYSRYRKAAKPARFGLYYGAGIETIWRKAVEVDRSVTVKDVEKLVAAHNETYPDLDTLFSQARMRPRNPGWLAWVFGGRRRFRYTKDEKVAAAQGRESQNAVCQGSVASTINVGLGNLVKYRRKYDVPYRINLSVHDSVVLEVRKEYATKTEEALHTCLVSALPYQPCTLDGIPVTGRGPYRFAIDIDVVR